MVSKKSYRKFTKTLSGHIKRFLGIEEAVKGAPLTPTPIPLPPPPIPECVDTECTVCRMPDLEIHKMVQCKHPVCYPCLMQFFINLITDRSTGGFECPCCNESLHPDDFYQTVDVINNTEFQCLLTVYGIGYICSKFEKEYLTATLNKIHGLVWCPGIDCSYAVISIPGSKCPKATCQIETCGIEFCTTCKCEWHSGMSCKDHQKLDNELKKSLIVKGKLEDFKMCPKCGVTVNRIEDGMCNEMRCTVCSTNFCWLCLKPAEKMHFTITGRCPLYGKQKKAKWVAIVLPIGFSISAPIIFTFSAICISGYLVFYYPFENSKKYYLKHLEKRGKFKSICLSILRTCVLIPWTIISSCALFTLGIPISLGYFYYALSKTIIQYIIKRAKSKEKSEDDSISTESTEST